MKFIPTQSGGRIVEGDSAYGSFRVEWNVDGKLVSHKCEIVNPPIKPKRVSPGDMLHKLIRAVTNAEPSSDCQCGERRTQMNQWGWMGCWRNRRTIIGWMIEEAGKRGHDISGDHVWTLIKPVIQEAMARRR